LRSSTGTLYIGIFGRKIPNTERSSMRKTTKTVSCDIKIGVKTIDNEQLLHKMNMRNGQVILPRDLHRILGVIK